MAMTILSMVSTEIFVLISWLNFCASHGWNCLDHGKERVWKGAESKIEGVMITRKSDNLKSIICDWVVIVEHRDWRSDECKEWESQ